MKPITIAIIAALILLNTLSFILMGYDKRCAKKGKWRVPEKTLFISAALFGAFGGCLGMWGFRHKTKHWYFKVFFPLMLLIQAGILGYVFAAGILN